MPKCEGLPTEDCPLKVNGPEVKLCQHDQGDLLLCPQCEKTADVRSKTPASAQAQSQGPLLCDPKKLQQQQKQQQIVNPLLTYIVFATNSGTQENVKEAVIGHFTLSQMQEARDVLWDTCSVDIIGDKPGRNSRSKKEAYVSDIMSALSRLDKAETMPMFLIDAFSLRLIPRAHPEELNNITLIDRLNRYEYKLKTMQEAIDRIVCENLEIKDILKTVPPTYSEIASGSKPLPDVQKPYETAAVLTGEQKPIPSVVSGDLPPRVQITGAEAGKSSEKQPMRGVKPDVPADNQSDSHGRGAPRRGRGRGRGSGRERGWGLSGGFGRGSVPHSDTLGFTTHMLSRALSIASLDRASIKSDCRSTRDQSHDSEEFQFPSYASKKLRKQEARRRKVITGTSGYSGNFKGAPEPTRDLFLSRVDSAVSGDDIRAYLSEQNVTVRALVKISHDDSKFKSFKLSVPVSVVHNLLQDSMWPSGVRVRRYVAPNTERKHVENW